MITWGDIGASIVWAVAIAVLLVVALFLLERVLRGREEFKGTMPPPGEPEEPGDRPPR